MKREFDNVGCFEAFKLYMHGSMFFGFIFGCQKEIVLVGSLLFFCFLPISGE
jgi:hypothetical protein